MSDIWTILLCFLLVWSLVLKKLFRLSVVVLSFSTCSNEDIFLHSLLGCSVHQALPWPGWERTVRTSSRRRSRCGLLKLSCHTSRFGMIGSFDPGQYHICVAIIGESWKLCNLIPTQFWKWWCKCCNTRMGASHHGNCPRNEWKLCAESKNFSPLARVLVDQ